MAHGLMGPVVLPHASSQYTLVVPSHRRCRLQSRSAWSHSRRSTLPAKTLTIAHGTASAATAKKPRPGEKKGFVEEMRFVAMRLHTKDQAPKEGGQEAAPQPFQKWQPTKEGYLKFLVESKEVFQTMEDIVQEASHPEYAKFQNTGLERSQPLAADVAWFKETYGLTAPQPEEDGPGQTYSRLLKQLAVENPPAFICHFYNIYFAHSAGGRMIGKKVASMCLDGAELNFYKYDGELSDLLDKVRNQLNEVAENWSEEDKVVCLDETTKSFQYSGGLMRAITS